MKYLTRARLLFVSCSLFVVLVEGFCCQSPHIQEQHYRTSRRRRQRQRQPLLYVNNDPVEGFQGWHTDYDDDESDDESVRTMTNNNNNNNNNNNKSVVLMKEDYEPLQENRQLIDTTNTVLRTFHRSFKNVETMANDLLNENPILSIVVFVGCGLFVAYTMGFFLLDGEMESILPTENGQVPYWDEEILVIERKIPSHNNYP